MIHMIAVIIIGVLSIVAGLGYWYSIYEMFKWSKETGKEWELHEHSIINAGLFIMILPPLLPIIGVAIIVLEVYFFLIK